MPPIDEGDELSSKNSDSEDEKQPEKKERQTKSPIEDVSLLLCFFCWIISYYSFIFLISWSMLFFALIAHFLGVKFYNILVVFYWWTFFSLMFYIYNGLLINTIRPGCFIYEELVDL